MRKWYFTNFPLGMLLGVILATIAFFALDYDYLAKWDKYFTYGISALIALLGAGIATASVLANIQMDEQRRKNAQRADRYSLNLPLSNLLHACKKAIIFSLDETLTDPQTAENRFRQIPLSTSDTKAIQAAIESASPENAERLANLIRHYQVYLSRLESIVEGLAPKPLPNLQRGLIKSKVTEQDRVNCAADFAVLWRLTEDVLLYARGDCDKISPRIKNTKLSGIFYVDLLLDRGDQNGILSALQKELASRSEEQTLEL